MNLHEMYENAKNEITGGGGLSPALDAYAEAYFREPPVSGEWTEETIREELFTLLWNHFNGSIDVRRHSARSILRERLDTARRRLQASEADRRAINEEKERMASFIERFHLASLYEAHLEDIRTGAFLLYPADEALPFL